MEQAEARYRAMFESASDAIISTDAAGRIDLTNAQAERAFGYRREELLGQFIEMLVPPRFAAGHVVHRAAYLGDPHLRPMGVSRDAVARRKDGTEFPVEVTLNPVNTAAEVRVMAVIRDISERKAAEAEILRLNAELEERVADRTAQLQNAVKQLEAFSYSVSHDLRAPLRAINGFAAALVEDYAGRLDGEAAGYLKSIGRAAERMGKMIDDLLVFSRMGRKPIEPQIIDMDKLARSVWKEILPAGSREIACVWKHLDAARGDVTLVRQVWVNLISNAVKFTSRREGARVEIGCHAGDDGKNAYYVKDNGAGFDMKFADKLFGVFQRLHAADDFDGTGVGLAIVQSIVQRHGGRVWAEGQVDEGAAFFFTLPKEGGCAGGK